MSLFTTLQHEARRNSVSAAQLRALEATLNHFQVRKGRGSVADALLRFRIVKDHDLKFNSEDPLMGAFLRMDEYLTGLIGGKQAVCSP